MSDTDKDIEILTLRHQLAILQRQACRLHRAGLADQGADLVERELGVYGGDADRQVGGETQES